MSYLVIIIVCVISTLATNPIAKVINRRVGKKWLATVIELLIFAIISLCLYMIASLIEDWITG